MKQRLAAALAAGFTLLAPALAFACPVCGVGSEANRRAFVGSTIFLSLLPLTLIGGLIGWGIWRVRKQEREQSLGVTPPEDRPRRSGAGPEASVGLAVGPVSK